MLRFKKRKQKLESASPEHLKDRLHAAQMKRVDAEGIMAQSQPIIASGSEHKELLNDRVNDLIARIKSLNENIISRSDMIDELQASNCHRFYRAKGKRGRKNTTARGKQGT